MTSLQGKVAIVTGGSREIGAAMAQALAGAGAAVVIAYQGASASADAVVARIRAAGGQAASHQADLSNVADNQRLVAQAVEAFGRLDDGRSRAVSLTSTHKSGVQGAKRPCRSARCPRTFLSPKAGLRPAKKI